MSIYGAIIGDVAGSYYEVLEMKKFKSGRSRENRIKILDNSTPLFSDQSSITDDSILTLAVADAILSGASYEQKIREYGLAECNRGIDQYGRSKFGDRFIEWLNGGQNKSWGNGASMRVSPVAYAFNSLDKILSETEKCSTCSHDSEATIHAQAVAGAIYLARTGKTKSEIKAFCEKLIGKVDFNLTELQINNHFYSRSSLSVPQAIYCFLISNNFEDAIRTAISIGGDTDTIACIAGSIAGAFYGIPDDIKTDVKKFLPPHYLQIAENFDKKFCQTPNKKSQH